MSGLENIETDDFFGISINEYGCISDDNEEEKISDVDDDENNLLSEKVIKSDLDECKKRNNQDGTSMWSSVFEETKELMHLPGNGSSSKSHSANYEAQKIWKGSRSKLKPKFSFGLHFDREACLPSTSMDASEKSTIVHQELEGLEELQHRNKEHSMTELLESLQKENKTCSEPQHIPFELSSDGHRRIEHPIQDRLEGLLEYHGPQIGPPRMNHKTKGKRSKLTFKRNRPLACIALDEGDPAEPMDSTTSSDEEAAKPQLQDDDDECQLKLKASEVNGQTMADRFLEALNAAAVNDDGMLFATHKQIGIGYYGRLQQVMQTEKERHMKFLNQSQAGVGRDEVRCIDVKILSRYLDAKLTVCQCSLPINVKSSKFAQSPEKPVDSGEKRTIIFSSMICNNVELEVGNFVRIHPPWKEVEIRSKDVGIILCTYFSEISV
ncbi:Mitogen-activated protein kinase [Thalictrum thalictroides]|uniref:Mitogen-activated protein kinase n=1 Tax=Thalictrum thalictroides TaxID=46969 RepID=A0A7J6UY82_THATH|nr:Mitogen-activated protein kinase [Thalictrum thalictroides]